MPKPAQNQRVEHEIFSWSLIATKLHLQNFCDFLTPGRAKTLKRSFQTPCHESHADAQQKSKKRGLDTCTKIAFSPAMGRQAIPNAILKQKGSRDARDNEPEFSGGFGEPPRTLDGIALATWKEVARELENIGMGSIVERTALECYCHAVAAFHQANNDIAELGSVVQSERGYTRNPACLNQNAAMGQILKFAIQFGLTPASRNKIHVAKKEEINEFDTL